MKSVKQKNIKRVNIHSNDALGSLLKVEYHTHRRKLFSTFKRSEDVNHKTNKLFVTKKDGFEV